MNSKKGLIIEALIRTVIAVILVVVVLNIGKNAGEAAGLWGTSQSMKSLGNLADKLNSPDLKDGDSRQEFITLDKGTALIGFSKNTKEFKCYGCQQVYGSAFSDKLLYYSIDKPSNRECAVNACICACSKDFALGAISDTQTKINCGSFSCRTLNDDLPSRISLEDALKNRNIQIASYPYWENGFFFARRGSAETPLNGMMPPNDAIKITVYIEKKQINNNAFVAACPMAPCIQQQK